MKRASEPIVVKEPEIVSMDYPKMVTVDKLLNDAAYWSGKQFILDPKYNRSLHIYSPKLLNKTDAYNLLVASLEAIGLRFVVTDQSIVKIVETAHYEFRV